MSAALAEVGIGVNFGTAIGACLLTYGIAAAGAEQSAYLVDGTTMGALNAGGLIHLHGLLILRLLRRTLTIERIAL